MDLIKLYNFLKSEWEVENTEIPFKFTVLTQRELDEYGYQASFEITGSKKHGE